MLQQTQASVTMQYPAYFKVLWFATQCKDYSTHDIATCNLPLDHMCQMLRLCSSRLDKAGCL